MSDERDARCWRALVAMFPDRPLDSRIDGETITRGEMVELLAAIWSTANAMDPMNQPVTDDPDAPTLGEAVARADDLRHDRKERGE